MIVRGTAWVGYSSSEPLLVWLPGAWALLMSQRWMISMSRNSMNFISGPMNIITFLPVYTRGAVIELNCWVFTFWSWIMFTAMGCGGVGWCVCGPISHPVFYHPSPMGKEGPPEGSLSPLSLQGIAATHIVELLPDNRRTSSGCLQLTSEMALPTAHSAAVLPWRKWCCAWVGMWCINSPHEILCNNLL